MLLSALGGAAGTLLGIALAATYATIQHWPTVVPGWASAGGVAATLLIGALAAPGRRGERDPVQTLILVTLTAV